ncbi:deoxynucleoside kinase [Carboxylicivirga linearis]|uniref:Deoxynucleoside kinase n=1 Tax=Carboxylicivirga linearis TaxID=1628157 RepID=A0ABS5JST4_9BACT|nr:deoxynucleoside kinase [Carboxylicivirga linearis]MBS2097939.1 deoxynucleoside kinase [Carboxylicivirga linearis]
MNKLNKKYLVIEGNIGTGKSTLAQMISKDFDARLVMETFADNPFLPKFYNDQERYAFPLELSFLAERYKQLKKDFDTADLFHELTLADYHFFKSLIFAAKTLPEDEYRLYRQIFDIIYGMTPVPDLYVYLHRPVEILIQQIKKRGREYEKSIDTDYLKSIQEGYFQFFKEHPELPVLLINLDDINFETDKSVYNSLITLISKEYPKGITRVNVKTILG